MSYSRYSKRPLIQPIRKITPAATDIIHTMSATDNIDTLAYQWYGDVTYGWIIMLANRQYSLEYAIPPGAIITIPYPLSRILQAWGAQNED